MALAMAQAKVRAELPTLMGATEGQEVLFLSGNDAIVYITRFPSANGRYVFQLRSSSGNREVTAVCQAWQERTPLAAPKLAALVTAGDAQLSGRIEVDGRDHAPDGTFLDNPLSSKLGVLAVGDLTQRGAAKIGGGAELPTSTPSLASVSQQTTFWSESDTQNGVDDDGDGFTDEDGFPDTRASLLGIADGELKARAQADGTVFTSLADYENWRASASPGDCGGKVFYLELPPGSEVGPLVLPDNGVLDASGNSRSPSPAPSVFVVASSGGVSDHSTMVGPLHVDETFQGLVLADRIRNLNGNGTIVGSIVSFNAGATRTTTLGNGGARLLYSSEVLDNLPGLSGGRADANVVAWWISR